MYRYFTRGNSIPFGICENKILFKIHIHKGQSVTCKLGLYLWVFESSHLKLASQRVCLEFFWNWKGHGASLGFENCAKMCVLTHFVDWIVGTGKMACCIELCLYGIRWCEEHLPKVFKKLYNGIFDHFDIKRRT